MAIAEIEVLGEDLQRELLPFIRECADCGTVIIGTPQRKRCYRCQGERIKDSRNKYFKRTFRSVGYEHDKYISGRK